MDYSKNTLIRLSPDGEIEWQKRISHPILSEGYFARNMLPTEDGGCIVVGEQREEGNWNSSVAKFGPRGALLWNRDYDFFNALRQQITGIAATNDGYVLHGSNYINNIVFKIDATGNPLWANLYNMEVTGRPKTVINDNNGNIIFTGSNIISSTEQPAYIVKLNSSGNVIFGKKYHFNAEMSDITLTADGYCAIGTVNPGIRNPPDNVYILKTDFDGNVGGNCTSSNLSVTKTPAEFIHVTEPGLRIRTDTFKVTNITLTTRLVNNFEQNWCGTALQTFTKTAQQPAQVPAGSFKAYTNIAAKEVSLLYNKTGAANSDKYEVTLYNSNGIAVAKKQLQPNIRLTISMAQQLPGIYMAVLLKNGSIVEKQNVIWRGRQGGSW